MRTKAKERSREKEGKKGQHKSSVRILILKRMGKLRGFLRGRERENSKCGCERQQLPNKEWLFGIQYCQTCDRDSRILFSLLLQRAEKSRTPS